MSHRFRIFLTVIWGALCATWMTGFNIAATLGTGKIAGSQFDASDSAYVATQAIFRSVNLLSTITAVFALVVLLLIWLKPLRALIAGLMMLVFLQLNKEL